MADVARKLAVLADAAKYDASCASSGGVRRDSRDGNGIGSTTGSGICHSYAPDGRCISLLKILLTNWCLYDCLYCVNRVSSDVERARFTVAEVVALTLDFYRRNVIEGLFLSSGIIRSPDYTMEQMVAVARELRETHRFRGYLHLKTIPDASEALLAEAGRHADRLSINIELPTQPALDALAPGKSLQQIRTAMAGIRQRLDEHEDARRGARTIRSLPGAPAAAARPPRFAPAGQSTQMIVGADGSDDRTILAASAGLYAGYRLKRVYYSAFSPIPQASSRLPGRAVPLMREHRLYQADWLMRFYGFEEHELVTPGGMLSLEHDPKLVWALAHPDRFPVDANRAPREQLLRVPGLGPRSVDTLLGARRQRSLRRADLVRLGAAGRRALDFVVLADHRPSSTPLAALGTEDPGATVPVATGTMALPSIGAARLPLQRPRPALPLGAGEGRARRELQVQIDAEDIDAALARLSALIAAGIEPDAVTWRAGDAVQAELFDRPGEMVSAVPFAGERRPLAALAALPAGFAGLARLVAMHEDPARFTRLHRMAVRIADDVGAWRDPLDPERIALERMARDARREIHKMHAFVRFRVLEDAGEGADHAGERRVAWFEPRHAIVRAAMPFFVERFAAMRWSILTPRLSAHWAQGRLVFGPGADRARAPAADAGEALWLAYYRSIFNPSRVNPAAMRREMPRRYWANLPETALVPDLVREAPARSARMREHAADTLRRLPVRARLQDLAARARHCSECDCAGPATQMVWGEGASDAALMIVGEQPGHHEDLAGRPFVGPAGQLLHRALAVLGRPAGTLYLTNAVKHFRFEPRGKRRIHKTPGQREMMACAQWLEAEIAQVRPQAILALGATAATSLLGRPLRLGDSLGHWLHRDDGLPVWVVHHPAAVLRRAESGAPSFEAWVDAMRPAFDAIESRDVGRVRGMLRGRLDPGLRVVRCDPRP